MDTSNSTLVPVKVYHVMSSIQLKFSTSVRPVLPRNMSCPAGGSLNSHCSIEFARIRFACHSAKAIVKAF